MKRYHFIGKVKEGKKRGRLFHFPTANISLHKKIPEGVYISKTKIHNNTYPSLTFIGSAKTFNETVYQSETYLLDSNKFLYGTWMSVYLLRKIRGNEKFPSQKELVRKMKEDKKIAKKYFKRQISQVF